MDLLHEAEGATDYRKLVPIQPLASGRTEMLSKLADIQPVPNGKTGLYDTVLAAYKAVQNNWDPSRVNSVVIMTDGQNDDPGGMTLDQLISQLKSIQNPAKPVAGHRDRHRHRRQPERAAEDHRRDRRRHVRHRRPVEDQSRSS